MQKPSFRDRDETPSRGDDLRLTTGLGTLEASGKNVAMVVLLGLLVGLGVYHHHVNTEQHEKFFDAQQKSWQLQALYICVSTLTKEEQREFRVSGRYCGVGNVTDEVGRITKPEGRQ